MPGRILLSLLLLPLVAGPALAAEPKGRVKRTCVEVSDVNGWYLTAHGDLVLISGPNRQHLLALGPSARTVRLESSSRIALVPNSFGELCRLSGDVVADGRRLIVREIERIDVLTEAERTTLLANGLPDGKANGTEPSNPDTAGDPQ